MAPDFWDAERILSIEYLKKQQSIPDIIVEFYIN